MVNEPASPVAEEINAEDMLCVVCSEQLPPVHHAFCDYCMQPFHMRMLEGSEAKDCGNMWYIEDSCTTILVCRPCYRQASGA